MAPPWYVQRALLLRAEGGPVASTEYWQLKMTQQRRNDVDKWLMQYRKDVLKRCGRGPQLWRFKQLIEILHAERNTFKKP